MPDNVDARRRRMLQGLAAGVAMAVCGLGTRPARAQAGGTGAASGAGALQAQDLRGGLVLVTGAGGNVVLLPTAEGSVQVDSGSPDRAQDLAKLTGTRFDGAPSHTLFNTNWRLDHTGGNETVAPKGSTIISHENTRLWMSTKFYVDWEDRYYRPRKPEALPNKTFFSSDKQPLHVQVGGVLIEYAQLPEAHTDGDIYVRFPEQNVIVAGGCVTAGRYPMLDYITGGWIGGLADATKKLIDMSDADTLIVPDAGPPQRVADLEAQRTMLETVRQRIEAIALRGRGVEDMIAEQITKEFDEHYAGDPKLFISNAYEGMWWSRLRGIVA
ncbi:MAG TPA: MBL fold metallo-hydrolase [Gammaproteobacteria bacterium]|nr:MBL fold metallo-hydrolase [Gammaproteobacteria bacterium]